MQSPKSSRVLSSVPSISNITAEYFFIFSLREKFSRFDRPLKLLLVSGCYFSKAVVYTVAMEYV
jgi:hypothetical protein